MDKEMHSIPTAPSGPAVHSIPHPFLRLAILFVVFLFSLILWSCNTGSEDDIYTVTFKLDSARVGKFDSVRVDIYNGAAPGPGDTAKPAQTKVIALTPTTKEVTLQLNAAVKKDFSVVITGFTGKEITYRNLHEVDGFTSPDPGKPSILLISRIVAEDLTVNVGETRAPVLTITPENAVDKRILLFSADSLTVQVVGDSIKNLKGLKTGEAKVTATTADQSIKVEFTVNVVGVRVTRLKSDSLSLKVGDELEPAVTVEPDNATDKDFSMESSDPEVLAVSGKTVTALKAGNVKLILISADGGTKDTVAVSVRIAVTGLEGSDLVKEVGDRFAPVLEWTPSDATDQGYTLVSGDPSKVEVVGDSLVAQAVGTVVVTATSKDGDFPVEFSVQVDTKVIRVKGVTVATLRILVGDTVAPELTWDPANASDKGFVLISRDTAVAKAISDKLVGVKAGSSTILITSVDGGFKDSVEVTVDMAAFRLDILPITTIKCAPCHEPGQTFDWQDSAQLVRKGASAIDRINRPDSSAGKMPLKGAPNGALSQRQLRVLMDWLSRVVVPLKSVNLADMSANLGDTVALPLTWDPPDASNQQIILTTSDTVLASVVGRSIIPQDTGSVTVFVTTDDGGRKLQAKLNVSAPQFIKNVLPITIAKCTPCHGPDQVFNWQDSAALIGDGSNALDRLQRAPNAPGKMPLKGAQNGDLTPFELKVMLAWLNSKVVPLKGITVPNDSLFLGEIKEPSIDWNPANATNKSFILVSGDTAKVGIQGNELLGKALGSATVEVRAIDGDFSKFITVKVLPIRVNSIVVNDTGCAKDDSVYLKAVFSPLEATNQAFTVASVSVGGTKVKIDSGFKITALALGKDTLEATSADGSKKSRFVFTVGPVLPKTLTIPDANGVVGGTAVSLTLVWNPATTTDKTVTLAVTGDTSTVAAARGTALAPSMLPKTAAGQVTVTATSIANPTAKATFKFTVGTVGVTSFTITPITTFDSVTLSPVIEWVPKNPTNRNFTLILPVGDTGLVLTGGGTTLLTKRVGSRVVTVRSLDSNKTAPWTVNVIRTSFKNNILGITTAKCAVCHHETSPASQPNWKDSATVVAYATSIKNRISRVQGSTGYMPMGGSMKADTVAIITKWLNQ